MRVGRLGGLGATLLLPLIFSGRPKANQDTDHTFYMGKLPGGCKRVVSASIYRPYPYSDVKNMLLTCEDGGRVVLIEYNDFPRNREPSMKYVWDKK